MNRLSKTCLLIPLLWLFNHSLLYAQKEANIWYFGRNAGLNFNTEPPTVLTDSKMSTMEGCSSISDEYGNLLFYTDGQSVWNRYHKKMSNGIALNGDASSTHSSVIVKRPYSDSLFYIITADDWPDGSNENKGVAYSVVDMRLDSARGDIMEKNILMVAKSAEKIAATIHGNGSDVWIAIPEAGTNDIVMFLLTENGIQKHHVISGFFATGYWNWGQIKFSPNSKLLSLTNPVGAATSSDTRIAIADFDNRTGTISNAKYLIGSQNVYGLEFSPSSRFIYFSTWLGTAGAKNGIYQYDISSVNNGFLSTCIKITGNGYGQLQLAPNGKIYFPSDSFLSVINYPDSAGLGCALAMKTIYLQTGKSWYGLPTFYNSYVNKNRIQVDKSCLGELTRIYATKDTTTYDSAHWFVSNTRIPDLYFSFDHRFLSPGYFNIKLVMFRNSFTDTFEREVFIKPSTIINPGLPDIRLCYGDSAVLNAYKENGLTYQWNTGSPDSIINVFHAGTYVVTITKQGCSIHDTAIVNIESPLSSGLPSEITFCEKSSASLSVTEPDVSCLWSTSDTTHTIMVDKPGIYTVKLSRNQCSKTFSVLVNQTEFPRVYLGIDTLVCANAPFMLDVRFPHSSYQWSDLSTEPTLNANRDGMYWVEVTNTCGSASDTINVLTIECVCSIFVPNAFTPNTDWVNDIFAPRLNCPTLDYIFQIYDRWGQLIFKSNDPAQGWDGKLERQITGPENFFWIVSYSMAPPLGSGHQQTKTGMVTLLH
ncbi:MAG: gliding motility-associated C-terminal domain-containing protein [Bacteroidota bacterium]